MSNIGMTAAGRVLKAREQTRPTARDHIINIFDFFFELSGDRSYGNDKSIVCGIARLDSRPVTVIGQQKGRTLEENMEMRFGMPDPEGYRKAMRMMKQAEKFRRPVITFIDTPGAFPGKEAEERGQGMAIAECIEMMSRLKVPCISVFIGEGGSDGTAGGHRGGAEVLRLAARSDEFGSRLAGAVRRDTIAMCVQAPGAGRLSRGITWKSHCRRGEVRPPKTRCWGRRGD